MLPKMILAIAALSLSLQLTASETKNIVEQIKDRAEALFAQEKFSGAILVSHSEQVLFERAYGEASRRFHVPNTIETRFNLGSGNKMFTAIAVLQLVEQGQLNLTDTLDTYLDETWLPHAISRRIEIQHLLTHASGLSSYFTEEFFNTSRDQFRNLEDFKPLMVTDTLAFEPGSDYKYSNNGMMMLGAVVQVISGLSYYEYIDQHVYAVAGMKASGCFDMDMPYENVAIGYHVTDETTRGVINNTLIKPIKGGPAGGCYSTVHDMHRFANALLDHKLLGEELTQSLFSPKPQFHNELYGFGFKIRSNTPGNRIVGHRGGFYGVSASFEMHLDTGYTAVILTNLSGAAHELAPQVRDILSGIK